MPLMIASPLPISDEQRAALEVMARSSSLPYRKVVQSRALLFAADGVAINEVARRCGTSAESVRAWRRRFAEQGVEGVGRIAPGRGRRPWLREGTVAEVVRVTLEETPEDGSTHWTTRSLAQRFGIGKDTVARIWRNHNLKPWKVDTFKISNDPDFEEKLVDVVGLYMDPPERAVVFSFDEKTQVQALDGTQPSLPLKPGRAETMTHDYKRNGTTDLFAALNVATGEVIYDTKPRHSAKEVLGFFKLIDLHVPRHLDVHVVLDNLSAHKAPAVAKWLAHPRRKRWHLHFTPTSSSWLNLVEGWLKQLTDRRLRRGTFTSVDALIEAIEVWAERWNDDPKPFVWRKTADDIITKVRRGRNRPHPPNQIRHAPLGVPGPKSIESSPSPVAVPAATLTTPGPEESPNRRRPPTVKTMVSSPAPGLTLDTLVVIVSSPPSPKIWSLKRRLKAPSVILSLPGPPWSSSGSSDPAMTSSPGPPKTLVTRTAPVMSMWSLPSPPQMTSVPPCAGDRVVSLEAVDQIVARRTRESIVPATAGQWWRPARHRGRRPRSPPRQQAGRLP